MLKWFGYMERMSDERLTKMICVRTRGNKRRWATEGEIEKWTEGGFGVSAKIFRRMRGMCQIERI